MPKSATEAPGAVGAKICSSIQVESRLGMLKRKRYRATNFGDLKFFNVDCVEGVIFATLVKATVSNITATPLTNVFDISHN
jgi:hypothetical protein